MSFEQFVFYFFAALVLFAGFRVITVRNPVHAALFLALAFIASAGLWLLLEAEFLAVALVLVYVGAVVVLFLFVIMMLDINIAQIREGFARYLPVGVLIAAAMIVQMVLIVGPDRFGAENYAIPERSGPEFSNTEALGQALYTEYLYPFEIAAAILLVAIIAAIVLTLRRRPGTKYQTPSEQVKVRRQDRVRLVKIKSEEKD